MKNIWIAHHGIEGQKWGRRNGPPYPLDYKSHSAEEKRKNSRSELSGYDNSFSANKRKSRVQTSTSKKILEQKYEPNKVKRAFESKLRKDVPTNAKEAIEANGKLLKKNPNAAVVGPNFFQRNKKAIIGAAVGIGAAGAIAAGVAYANRFNHMSVEELTAKGRLSDNAKNFMADWLNTDLKNERYKAITEDEYKALLDDSFKISSGASMFRMMDSKHTSLRDDMEYVSFGEDRDIYKGALPQIWKMNGGPQQSTYYEAVLKSKEIVNVPSKKKVIDTLESVYYDELKGGIPDNDLKGIYEKVARKAAHDKALNNFNLEMTNLVARTDTGNELFSRLSSEGFNAIVDYNDANRLSKRPLILFKGSKTADVSSVLDVSISEVNSVFNNLAPIHSGEELNTFDNLPIETQRWLNKARLAGF